MSCPIWCNARQWGCPNKAPHHCQNAPPTCQLHKSACCIPIDQPLSTWTGGPFLTAKRARSVTP